MAYDDYDDDDKRAHGTQQHYYKTNATHWNYVT
jgi:hypothetical protein